MQIKLDFIICVYVFPSFFLRLINYYLFRSSLVPGDGGSQLEAKLDKPEVVHYFCSSKTNDYFTLWINLEEIVPYAIDCFADNMRLVYNNITRKTSNSPGVDIRVPDFGSTQSVEFLDPSRYSLTGYFNILVEGLLKLGYIRNETIRGAPYDFRKSPRKSKTITFIPLLFTLTVLLIKIIFNYLLNDVSC